MSLSGGLWKKKASLHRKQGLKLPNCTKDTRRVSRSSEGGRLIVKLRTRMLDWDEGCSSL